MKKLFFLGLVMSFFLGMHLAQASNITNLSALYTTDNKIFLQWDHLDDSLLFDTDGYAIQFSIYENKVRNVDPGRLFLPTKQNDITLRGAQFESNEWYYFRVYTYVQDGRSRILTNGSKVLKWKYLDNGEMEMEILEPNDPVISDNNADIGIDFGKLRVRRYDTYATFSWSRPNLAKNDASGVVIVINESGSADTLVELKAGLDITTGKVTGLTPSTQYEAKGYFYKRVGGEDQKFGAGTTESFTTQAAYSASQKAQLERLRKRGLVKDNALTTVNVPGSTTTTDSEDDEEDTTTTSTTTSTTTTTSGTLTRAQILTKIANLEQELQKWRLELKKLGTSSNSRFNRTSPIRTPDYSSPESTSSSRTTTKKPRESIRERMCRILKRNCN
jgi:hypothetical protein